jgi:hypothetical protein
MNQQLLHQIRRQPENAALSFAPPALRRAKGIDFDQFEVELVYYGGGLERMIRTLGPHARGGDPPELRVEKLHQSTGGLMVAVAKARHQQGHGIGLKTAWDRHSGT